MKLEDLNIYQLSMEIREKMLEEVET